MKYLEESLIQLGLMALYCILHSILAGTGIKNFLFHKFPATASFYRLGYNIIAMVTAYIFLVITPKPALIVYDLKFPFDIIILIPQMIGLAGFIWTMRYFNGGEFLGITQAYRYVTKRQPETSDEQSELSVAGPYKLSRHPLYLFSIIWLVFRPQMSLFYLLLVIAAIVYFFIGSMYEEKKLISRFGNKYVAYSKSVPRIIPNFSSLQSVLKR